MIRFEHELRQALAQGGQFGCVSAVDETSPDPVDYGSFLRHTMTIRIHCDLPREVPAVAMRRGKSCWDFLPQPYQSRFFDDHAIHSVHGAQERAIQKVKAMIFGEVIEQLRLIDRLARQGDGWGVTRVCEELLNDLT